MGDGDGRLVLFYPVVLLHIILLYEDRFFASAVDNISICSVAVYLGARFDAGFGHAEIQDRVFKPRSRPGVLQDDVDGVDMGPRESRGNGLSMEEEGNSHDESWTLDLEALVVSCEEVGRAPQVV